MEFFCFFKMKSLIKKIKSFHLKITTNLFLACSDCDGMCNHCNDVLNKKCQKFKLESMSACEQVSG